MFPTIAGVAAISMMMSKPGRVRYPLPIVTEKPAIIRQFSYDKSQTHRWALLTSTDPPHLECQGSDIPYTPAALLMITCSEIQSAGSLNIFNLHVQHEFPGATLLGSNVSGVAISMEGSYVKWLTKSKLD
jgi:hypothetical protein